MNDDQGHDHVHHSPRDCGRGEVRQGHVRVNGIVQDVWRRRGEIVRVRRGISGATQSGDSVTS